VEGPGLFSTRETPFREANLDKKKSKKEKEKRRRKKETKKNKK
jgi:hypothetical protein